MKLLTSFLPTSVPIRATAQVLFSALVVAAIFGLEIAGRYAESDRHDGLAALTLVCLIGLVSIWHRHRPLHWVEWLQESSFRLQNYLLQTSYEFGMDLRGTPKVPNRLPSGIWLLASVIIAWGAFSVVVWYLLPGGWRQVGTHTSYVVYLVVLLALWFTLLSALVAGMFVPLMALDRLVRGLFHDSNRRPLLFIAALMYLFGVITAGVNLPLLGALIPCAAALIVAVRWWAVPTPDSVALLWRRHEDEPIYAIPTPRLIAIGVTLLTLGFVAILLMASGGRVTTPIADHDPMHLTGRLAATVAWTAPGLFLLLGTAFMLVQWGNPSRKDPPTLWLKNDATRLIRQKIQSIIDAWHWNLKAEKKHRGRLDVAIELVHPEFSEAEEFEPRWPLKMSMSDFAKPDVQYRLKRRDEIQLRRRFFAGLNQLFKQANQEREHKGGAYWFAPHWWFFEWLRREEPHQPRKSEEFPLSSQQIGPSLSAVFPRRVRQHLFQVFRAMQIDVAYIEDGVSPKKIERVMRSIFEVYDQFDGQKIVDDHCFQGIPKIQVVIHDIGPEVELLPIKHKQPKFDDLSRARVLHIFRDNTGEEEEIEPPFDFSSEPMPALSLS